MYKRQAQDGCKVQIMDRLFPEREDMGWESGWAFYSCLLYTSPDLETVPKRLAIVRANRYMVERSDFLIAYVWHPASNCLLYTSRCV